MLNRPFDGMVQWPENATGKKVDDLGCAPPSRGVLTTLCHPYIAALVWVTYRCVWDIYGISCASRCDFFPPRRTSHMPRRVCPAFPSPRRVGYDISGQKLYGAHRVPSFSVRLRHALLVLLRDPLDVDVPMQQRAGVVPGLRSRRVHHR